MDPVTAVGLVASVSQLIHIAVRSVQYLNDLKDANKDRVQLLQEASNVLPLLISLRSRLEESSGDESWSNGIRSLGVAQGPLDQLRASLEQIAEKLEATSSVKTLGRAVQWPFQKKKCKEILDRIDRAKSLINLALQNDTLYVLQIRTFLLI